MENPEEYICFDERLKEKGILLKLYVGIFRDFDNSHAGYSFENNVAKRITDELRAKYDLKTLKDQPIFRDFRKFYWDALNIDPTKRRPAGEALVRRILSGKGLYSINCFVDAYNWASAASGIPISAYDLDTFTLPLTLRFARKGEVLHAIGGKIFTMQGNEVVIASEDGKILTQFPFRDSDLTKVSPQTRNIMVIVLGIGSIEDNLLKNTFAAITHNLELCMNAESGQSLFQKDEIRPEVEFFVQNK